MQHIAVFGSAQGIRWRLNHIHSMKYAEVIIIIRNFTTNKTVRYMNA